MTNDPLISLEQDELRERADHVRLLCQTHESLEDLCTPQQAFGAIACLFVSVAMLIAVLVYVAFF